MTSQVALTERDSGEFEHLLTTFFAAVSFEEGGRPRYELIHDVFVSTGLLIRNSLEVPEIWTLDSFVQSRKTTFATGDLTRFNEVEVSATTQVFGRVAHRFSVYDKSGTLKGAPFAARGMISTQFIMTPSGWKMSAMAWDDERPGLSVQDDYQEWAAILS